jgi:hypothetical protein
MTEFALCVRPGCLKTVAISGTKRRKYCSSDCEVAVRFPDTASRDERIKQLRLEKVKVRDIALLLACPQGTVASACSRLIALGEIPRGLTLPGWAGNRANG